MRIEAAASAKPSGILLREKDLSDAAYAALAAQCRTICATQGVPLIVNRILSTPNPSDWLQLPFPIFQQHRRETLPGKCIGVSVHALEEACTAQKLGADFLIAGHIFSTACKKDCRREDFPFARDLHRLFHSGSWNRRGLGRTNSCRPANRRSGCLHHVRMDDTTQSTGNHSKISTGFVNYKNSLETLPFQASFILCIDRFAF